MLTSIHIKNYTLADSLEIDFQRGTTAITGETGAGKSLILDALGMALGDRADTDTIRHGEDKAEISATFELGGNSDAIQWLEKHDFSHDEQCILRRLYTIEGRSRGYINGQPCTMQQLQQLGEMLTDIHSQHEHQSLLRSETHQRLLDEYANSTELASQVADLYRQWRLTRQKLDELQDRAEELNERKQLLEFQIDELNQLNLEKGELESLETEQQSLSNAEEILKDSHNLLAICDQAEGINLRENLNRALSILSGLKLKPEALQNVEGLLNEGLIQIEEAIHEIESHIDRFELDPARLEQVEERLSAIFHLARKHRVNADHLPEVLKELEKEFENLNSGEENIEVLQEKEAKLAKEYTEEALKLSKARFDASSSMASKINRQLHALSMAGAELIVELTALSEGQFSSTGNESVCLLISTNPGQPAKPLHKIASGGELSRVSLAIQVVAASHSRIPTLIFDEVDVGIGGGTADVVGQLLQQLGNQGQVISVTHQAQVAARAHQHYRASKVTESNATASLMQPLNQEQRISELARMLGGAKITEQTLSHAREMLDLASEST